MERAGISKEQAMQLGKFERDLGSADASEPAPQSRAQQTEPTVINVGYLPAEHPMCPHCHTGLHPVRQNPQGDSLFECVQSGCAGDGYMAVFRLAGPRWEHYQGRYGAERPGGWQAPLRLQDLEALKDQVSAGKAAPGGTSEFREKPAQAWPEAAPDSKPEPRRRKVQKA